MSSTPSPPFSSGYKIDYTIRPAKAVERYILVDFIQLLMQMRPGVAYRYFGLGSYAFKDFIVMERFCLFERLVSAENDLTLTARCKFNRPSSKVSLCMDDAGIAVNKLNWKVPHVLWLDYDGQMEQYVLDDVEKVASKAAPGTMVIVTLNVHYSIPVKDDKVVDEPKFLNGIREKWGAGNAVDITAKSLMKPLAAKTIGTVLDISISKGLRSNLNPLSSRIGLDRVATFLYQDGARMATYIILLDEENPRNQYSKLLSKSPLQAFTRRETYDLELPILTPKERRQLQRSARGLAVATKAIGVKHSDVLKFPEISRYMPFMEEINY